MSRERLDQVLCKKYPDRSRSHLQRLVEEGHVLVDGAPVFKPAQKVLISAKIRVSFPDPKPSNVQAQEIPITVVYEDQDLVVVDKQAGLVVHPAAGAHDGTLVNALLYRISDLSGIGGEKRPGIVHRLDKGTSGLMVIAKNDETHRHLVSQFQERAVEKHYEAIVFGIPKPLSGTIRDPIGRDPIHRKKYSSRSRHPKTAVTHYQVMRQKTDISWLHVKIETGRTHQIRVHLSEYGHPVIGDRIYGSGKQKRHLSDVSLCERLESVQYPLLHACHLSFKGRNGEKLMFASVPGIRFLDVWGECV